MDRYSRAFYELTFKVAFMEKKGNSFQDFFSSLMEKRHPGDFQRIRPWGSSGDKKNDGYLKSQRTLFQCYAPNEMKAMEAITKIEEDFLGALSYWSTYFDTWIFVHNSMYGLGPDVEMKLLELETANPSKTLKNWGFEELRVVVFELREADIASLLGGYAPTMKDIAEVGYKDVQPLLAAISTWPELSSIAVRPVPPDKIEKNKLSLEVQILLKGGMNRSDLLREYFAGYPDPTYGDRLANAFAAKYNELKEQGLPQDDIFYELIRFTEGDLVSQKHAAVLVVLAYFFTTCDIYERPQSQSRP